MAQYYRFLAFLFPLFFLSSCFSVDSRAIIGNDGKIRLENTVDMSQMATMMQSIGSGANSTEFLNPHLCEDKNFSAGLNQGGKGVTVLRCTDLGDYHVRVESETPVSNIPSILVMPGVVVVDAMGLASGPRSSAVKNSVFSQNNPNLQGKDLGISIMQSVVFPSTIVYNEGGSMSGTNMITFDLTDTNIAKKKELFVIATSRGTKLRPSEINKYKQMLRKQMNKGKIKR